VYEWWDNINFASIVALSFMVGHVRARAFGAARSLRDPSKRSCRLQPRTAGRYGNQPPTLPAQLVQNEAKVRTDIALELDVGFRCTADVVRSVHEADR